jgi:site-specific DNA recombinase
MSTVIYCRVSSQGQSDTGSSLESQATACREYAESNNLTVTSVTKEVFSGAYLFDRPMLDKIRTEVRAGQWDAVVVYAIDRLTRNIAHLMILSEEFERYGTALHIVTETLDNTPEGKLLQSVKGYVGEVEREKIRERTMRGRRTKALNGTLSHGRRLYGYTVIGGKRQIEPHEAQVVVSLFDRVKAGESLREIASSLNARHIPTPAAKPGAVWWANSVASILRNPAYAGHSVIFRYKHHEKRVAGRRSVTCSVTDPDKWVKLPDGTTPAIVNQDDFDKVQAILSSNKTSKRARPKRNFLLRGMVQCAICGRGMSTQMSHDSYRSYVCTSKQNPTTNCGVKSVNARKAEGMVWEEIERIIKDPAHLTMRLTENSNGSITALDSLRAEERAIQSKVARLDSEMANLVRRAETSDDEMWPIFEARMKAKHLEVRELKALHRTVLDDIDSAAQTQDDATAFENQRVRLVGLLDGMDFEKRVDVLKLFGIGVRWDGETLKLRINTLYGCQSNTDSADNLTLTISFPNAKETDRLGDPSQAENNITKGQIYD